MHTPLRGFSQRIRNSSRTIRTSPVRETQSESPVAAFEGHFSYDFKPRLRVSFDAKFLVRWRDKSERDLKFTHSSAELSDWSDGGGPDHQTLKISYNNRAYISYGGNYQNVFRGLAAFLDWLAGIEITSNRSPCGNFDDHIASSSLGHRRRTVMRLVYGAARDA